MHCHETLFFIRPLIHREIDYPQATELLRVTQTELTPHFQTKFGQLFTGLHSVFATQNKQQIAFFCTHFVCYGLKCFLCVELIYARFHRTILLYPCIYHSFRANLRTTYEIGQLVKLFAGISRAAFCADSTDIRSICKYTKALFFWFLSFCCMEDIMQLHKLHLKTCIWFVATIVFHSVCPCHTWKFG